ncbi:hypothetical protein BO79DRAFT_220030 [Aspergillus costaricaensis CBS 115574]|uniref:Uncharacterized protein n=1 Tax=Aspergillus costaricaensis CBS 115574 TaxID=1448317 RepID=A0ACD1I709_9EURO|nr:hypothetical protein BO79DRAFT_220030 [Aspergillus costaricaensis CBS 115574]RAK86351.1 hypothetical protein BO79DRAFT_220030 [Aspergillus costaricaensis CBS 115574]
MTDVKAALSPYPIVSCITRDIFLVPECLHHALHLRQVPRITWPDQARVSSFSAFPQAFFGFPVYRPIDSYPCPLLIGKLEVMMKSRTTQSSPVQGAEAAAIHHANLANGLEHRATVSPWCFVFDRRLVQNRHTIFHLITHGLAPAASVSRLTYVDMTPRVKQVHTRPEASTTPTINSRTIEGGEKPTAHGSLSTSSCQQDECRNNLHGSGPEASSPQQEDPKSPTTPVLADTSNLGVANEPHKAFPDPAGEFERADIHWAITWLARHRISHCLSQLRGVLLDSTLYGKPCSVGSICISYLLEISNDPREEYNEDVLTATTILRFYEQIEGTYHLIPFIAAIRLSDD